jgi:sensory rhodopsin
MIGSATTWAALGAVGMALGTLPAMWGLRTDPDHRTEYLTLFGVTGIAAVAYTLMAFEVGTAAVSGTELSVARYVDWLLTTPLILLFLATLGNVERSAVLRLVVVDVALLLLGGVAVVLSGPLQWVAFGGGVACFGVLVHDLYRRLPALASFPTERTRDLFVLLRNLTIVLWTLYPVVWLLAPTGVGLLTREMAMLVIAYLDLVSKAAFVALAVDGMDSLVDTGDIGVAVDDGGDPASTAD